MKVNSQRSRLAFAWGMARGDRAAWVATVINALFTHLFRGLLPVVYGLTIDEVIGRKDLSIVPALGLCFVILLIANEGLYAIGHVSWVYKITDFDSKIRRRILRSIMNAKASVLERRRSGDLAERIETDAQQITWYVDVFAVWIPDSLIALTIALLFMAAINPWIALMAAFSAPVAAYLAHRIGLRGRVVAEEYREKYGTYTSWLYEIIRGTTDIQQLGATSTVASWFIRRLRALIGLKIRSAIVELASERVREFVGLVLELVFFLVVSILVLSEQLTLGGYVAVATYFLTARAEVAQLSSMLFGMRIYTVGVDRIRDAIELESEDDDGRPLDSKPRSIVFDEVRFQYRPSVPVLKDISLRVDAGERVAIVGPSGAGKSSIVALLARLHDPDSGAIRVGSASISEYSRKSVRDWFGFVQQEPLIFSDSIRANLCLEQGYRADVTVSEDLLWEACETAQIKEMISGLPSGLDTVIGSEGRSLSGGEKQRLELARILLRRPRVLVIDEGLSAVDVDTERTIYRKLFATDSEDSTIIIAHRLSTIIDCGRILVLNDGVIAASGSHSDLIRDCTIYQRLFEEQVG